MAWLVGSNATPVIVRRVRPATLMAAGLVLAAFGLATLARLDSSSTSALFLMGSLAFSLGLALVFTLAIDLIAGAAPPERAGAASAVAETSAEFGGALGPAVYGTLGIAVYRGLMAGGLAIFSAFLLRNLGANVPAEAHPDLAAGQAVTDG